MGTTVAQIMNEWQVINIVSQYAAFNGTSRLLIQGFHILPTFINQYLFPHPLSLEQIPNGENPSNQRYLVQINTTECYRARTALCLGASAVLFLVKKLFLK